MWGFKTLNLTLFQVSLEKKSYIVQFVWKNAWVEFQDIRFNIKTFSLYKAIPEINNQS